MGRGEGKMLNTKILHVFRPAKVLSLGKEMNGELGAGHGWWPGGRWL